MVGPFGDKIYKISVQSERTGYEDELGSPTTSLEFLSLNTNTIHYSIEKFLYYLDSSYPELNSAMILWQTAKRWTYKGRNCEIQRTSVDGVTQYRGLVKVETGLPERALETAPVDEPRRKRRPMRREADEYRVWLCFDWEGGSVPRLRKEVNQLAEHVREWEL